MNPEPVPKGCCGIPGRSDLGASLVTFRFTTEQDASPATLTTVLE